MISDNSKKIYLSNQLRRNCGHIYNLHHLCRFHVHCMWWQHCMQLLVNEKRKMSMMSNITVLTFNLCQDKINSKNQFIGAVASVVSILTYTFLIIPTGWLHLVLLLHRTNEVWSNKEIIKKCKFQNKIVFYRVYQSEILETKGLRGIEGSIFFLN